MNYNFVFPYLRFHFFTFPVADAQKDQYKIGKLMNYCNSQVILFNFLFFIDPSMLSYVSILHVLIKQYIKAGKNEVNEYRAFRV